MATGSFIFRFTEKPALKRVFFGLCFLLATGFSTPSFSESTTKPEPRLEFGFGVGGQSLNHYRGSRETEAVILPFPVMIYRGDFWQVDEKDGIRGKVLEGRRYEVDLSGDLELRSSTKDNELREGMPELDTALQLGPELNLNLTGDTLNEGWMLRFPLRAAFAISLDNPRHIGYTFNPKLTFKRAGFFGDWRLKTDIALLYASGQLHEYYYAVKPEYVTATRPFYDASSGYSGAYAKVGFYKRNRNWIYKFSLRYDRLDGVTYEDSPLFESKDFYAFSFGVAYMFARHDW